MSILDFLVELGIEELLFKVLKKLFVSFCSGIEKGLVEVGLLYGEVVVYVASCRLVIFIKDFII